MGHPVNGDQPSQVAMATAVPRIVAMATATVKARRRERTSERPWRE